MWRHWVRRTLFERMPLTLAVMLAAAQVVLAQGLLLMWRDVSPLPATGTWIAAGALAGLHFAALPWAARWAGRRHWMRPASQLYLDLSFAAIVLAGGIAATAALAGLLGFAGADWQAAYRAVLPLVLLALSGVLVWGFLVEHRRLEVTQVPIPVAGLAPALAGLRIVHLSDFHIGNGMEAAELQAVVARANALRPDLVAITGDIFDQDPQLTADGARWLSALDAPLGVFVILGNHDHYTGDEGIRAAFAQHAPGLTLIGGALSPLASAAPLYIAGIDDPGADPENRDPLLADLADRRPDDGPTLLLIHRPDAFPRAAELGFPLVLAGHYHGGQLALPLCRGRWNAASLLSHFPRGRYRIGDSTLYVSRGVGTAVPRIRLASRPEIAVIELRPGSSAPRPASSAGCAAPARRSSPGGSRR